jgi:fructooligosaccharide transport system substrate-binding protein
MTKRMTSLLIALILTLSMFGFTASAEPITLKYISTGAGSWEQHLEPVIEKYFEETGVQVALECYAHTELFQVLDVQFNSGTVNYDIIAVDVPMVANYAENGYILPLTDYFTQEELDRYVDAAVSAGSWKGEFYAPPMNTSAQLLWYNKEFLGQAGIEMPEADPDNRVTYEELYDMAKKTLEVVDPDGSNAISGIAFGQISRAYQMLQLPNSLGEPSIGEDGLTVDGIINTDGWIKAMTYLHDIFANGVGLRGTTADEQSDLFFAGKTVFLIDGSWNTPNLEGNQEKWGYTYSPAWEGFEDKVATPTGSWHYGVAAGTSHPQEAIDFIKHMTFGEGSNVWLDARGDVPARKDYIESILTDPVYDEFGKSVAKIAAYEAANTAYPRPVTPAYSEYESLLNSMFEDVRNGADPATALDDCVNSVGSIMNKYRD